MNQSFDHSFEQSATMSLAYSAEAIFPLLCPVLEYQWIPTWKCEMLNSYSGVNELGCVFRTKLDEEIGEQVWVTCIFEPNKKVGFVCTNAYYCIRFTVTLVENGKRTNLTWHQQLVPLNKEGEQVLKKKDPQEYCKLIKSLEKMLDHYLSRGEMIKIDSLG